MFFGLTGAASELARTVLLKRESNAKVFATGYVLAQSAGVHGFPPCSPPLRGLGRYLEIHEMFLIYLGTMTLTAIWR